MDEHERDSATTHVANMFPYFFRLPENPPPHRLVDADVIEDGSHVVNLTVLYLRAEFEQRFRAGVFVFEVGKCFGFQFSHRCASLCRY